MSDPCDVNIAGTLFQNHELWIKLLDDTKAMGGFVDPTAEKFVRQHCVDARYHTLFQKSKVNFSFQHKMSKNVIFKDEKHVAKFFRDMSESDRNYKNAKEMLGETQAQINKMLQHRQIEIVPAAHRDEVTINPLNLLVKPNGKHQILVHWVKNPLYTKPATMLDSIRDNAHVLRKFKSVCKTDLKSAYRLIL